MKIMTVESVDSGRATSRLSSILTDPQHYLNPDSLYTIDAVVSGTGPQSAFQVFHQHHPDVVVINLDKVGDFGFEFCHRVRSHERDRHTGVVFFSETAQNDDKTLARVLDHGGDDFIDGRSSEREIIARINSVFRFKVTTDRLRCANHKLKTLSLTDELTGLSNMRAFNIEYQRLIRACRKGEVGLGIIMLDLDHFKSINDNANHLVGSFVIGEVGRLIAHSGVIGKDAIAARYGGDEYIVCVPTNSVGILWDMAERMQDLILRSVFKKEHYTIKLTGSFGIAWVEAGFEGKSDDLIKAADVMLYRSKRQGRNQVSGMILRYPVDFNHVGRPHLVDRESCREIDRKLYQAPGR
jgi:diguanylate cyclase (GGDEF)-like protein